VERAILARDDERYDLLEERDGTIRKNMGGNSGHIPLFPTEDSSLIVWVGRPSS